MLFSDTRERGVDFHGIILINKMSSEELDG